MCRWWCVYHCALPSCLVYLFPSDWATTCLRVRSICLGIAYLYRRMCVRPYTCMAFTRTKRSSSVKWAAQITCLEEQPPLGVIPSFLLLLLHFSFLSPSPNSFKCFSQSLPDLFQISPLYQTMFVRLFIILSFVLLLPWIFSILLILRFRLRLLLLLLPSVARARRQRRLSLVKPPRVVWKFRGHEVEWVIRASSFLLLVGLFFYHSMLTDWYRRCREIERMTEVQGGLKFSREGRGGGGGTRVWSDGHPACLSTGLVDA